MNLHLDSHFEPDKIKISLPKIEMLKSKDQCKLFRELILILYDLKRGNPAEDKGFSYTICSVVTPKLQMVNHDRELEKLIPSSNGNERLTGKFDRKCIFLKPTDRGTILFPMLSLSYDFGRSIPIVRLRLGLFLNHDSKVKGMGYRLESPEGVGRHHYYHVQLIKGFETGELFPPTETTEWLPDNEPTFPLDAEDSVDLLLCLILSLYGLDEFRGSISRISDNKNRKNILARVQRLRHIQIQKEDIYWSWKIIDKNVTSNNEWFCKTPLPPQEFRKILNRDYPNHSCKEITSQHLEFVPPEKIKVIE